MSQKKLEKNSLDFTDLALHIYGNIGERMSPLN